MPRRPVAKAVPAPSPEPRLPLAIGLMIAFSGSAILWAMIVTFFLYI